MDIAQTIKRLAAALHAAYERERETRMELLRAHAWKAMLVGILMSVTGTAIVFEEYIGIWTRPTLSFLAFVSGALLLYGLNRPGGRVRAEMASLIAVGLWDVLMAVAFVWTVVVHPADFQLVMPGSLEPLPSTQPRPYPIVVYLSLAYMVWGVHLRAVWRDGKKAARP